MQVVNHNSSSKSFLMLLSMLFLVLMTFLLYFLRRPLLTDINGLKIFCYSLSYQLVLFASLDLRKDKIISDCTKLVFITFFSLFLLASFALLPQTNLILNIPYIALLISSIYFIYNKAGFKATYRCDLNNNQYIGIVLGLIAFIAYICIVLAIYYQVPKLFLTVAAWSYAPVSILVFVFGLLSLFLLFRKYLGNDVANSFVLSLCFLFFIWIYVISSLVSNFISYDQILSPELKLMGAGHQDSYFHQTIINSIANFKTPSSMLDGFVAIRYHIASHFVYAGLQVTTGVLPNSLLMLGRSLFIVPMVFTVVLVSLALSVCFRSKLIYLLFLFFIMVFINYYTGQIYDSVGQTTASIMMISALPLFYNHIKSNLYPNYLTIFAFVIIALWCLFAKVSMGYVFIIAIGCWMLVYQGITKKLIVFSILCLAGIAASYLYVKGMGYHGNTFIKVVKLLINSGILQNYYSNMLLLPVSLLFAVLFTKNKSQINIKFLYSFILFILLVFFPILIIKIQDANDIAYFIIAGSIMTTFLSLFMLADLYQQKYLLNNEAIPMMLLFIFISGTYQITNWYGRFFTYSYVVVHEVSKENADVYNDRLSSLLQVGSTDMLAKSNNSSLANLVGSLNKLPKKLCKNKVNCIGVYIPYDSEYYQNRNFVKNPVANLYYFPANTGFPLFYGGHDEAYYSRYSYSARAAYGSDGYNASSRPKNDIDIKTVCKKVVNSNLDYLIIVNKIIPNEYHAVNCKSI